MSKFQIPDSLDGLSVDDILDLRAKAKSAASAILDGDSVSTEDIALAEQYAKFMDDADARVVAIREEQTATDARLAALRESVAKDAPKEPEAKKEPEPEAKEPEPEPVSENTDAEPEAVAEETPVPVAASAVSRAAANAPEPKAPLMNKKDMVITAAADIAGIRSGSTLKSVEEVTTAAMKRIKSFPKGTKSATRIQQGIAEFDLYASRDDGMYQGNPDYKTDQDVLVAAAAERRLPGNSLVAAGGWCAPPEVLKDFCSEVSTDGILDLPSMTVRSGSVMYTKGPDFSTIFADADGDWWLTEAEVIADTAKPCIEVECPTWDTITMDVTGVCVSAGILTNAAYPELVRAYIENVLIAHQHKIGAALYSAIDTASTALSGYTSVSATDSLAALEMYIEWVRNSKRWAFNTTVEVLLPKWYQAVVKWDLANRNNLNPAEVTDAMVNRVFAAKNLSVQWLYNTGQDAAEAGGVITPATTVDAIFYRAGTFVKLTNDLITLDGVYDSTNIKTNGYTALFTEEGIGLAQMCGDAYKVALEVCTSGQAGALDLTCTPAV